MPVFKQKCVFVIHDVEDKLILWEKKKSLVSEMPLKARLCSKETLGSLMAEASLQLRGRHPDGSSGQLLQLTSDSSAPWSFPAGSAESRLAFRYTAIARQLRYDL